MVEAEAWFRATVRTRGDEDADVDDEDDHPAELGVVIGDAEAQSASDAAACIEACEAVLRREAPLFPGAKAALQRLRALWRSAWTEWREAAGNGLTVPDLLWLAQCYLRLALRPDPKWPEVHATVASHVVHELRQTLRHWQHPHHHASVSIGVDSLEQRCVELTVFWASQDALLTPEMTEVDLDNHEMSILAINMDAEEEFDNRTRDTDFKATESATAAAPAPAAKRGRTLLRESVSATEQLPDPLELVRLGSRLAFFTRLQRTLVTPLPHGRYTVTSHAATGAEQAGFQAFLLQLAQFGQLNEAIGRHAQLWLQRSLLSLGALDHVARFLHLEPRHVGGATAVRYDPLRQVTDLALAHKLGLSTPDEALKGLWDVNPERNLSACDAHHKQLAREAWTLALLQHEFESALDLDWIDTYVVAGHELHTRRHVYQRLDYEMRPRLPVLLFACSVWCVQYPDECVKCDSLVSALLLWARTVRERHYGKTEIGRDISPQLDAWLSATPPATAAAAALGADVSGR
jgi:hypothetical protein